MKLFKIAAGFLMVAIVSSCSKQLDLAPISSISDNNYWKTPEQVKAFVSGIHIAFRNNTSAFEYLGELRADIFGTEPGSNQTFTGEATQGMEKMWQQNLNLDNPGVSNFGNFYFNINQINLLISRLNSLNIVSEADKSYYLGIAHGMRAFYYFQLLRSWGGVIIQTEPSINIDLSNLGKASSSADDVMQLIKSDIESSIANFGGDYNFRELRSYWSKSATLMLKAEVYLWTSYRGGGAADATVAKNALTDIQNNTPSLSLLPNYADVFDYNSKGNSEIIFAIRNRLNESQLPFAGIFFPQTGLISNFYDSVEFRKYNVDMDNWGGLLRAPVKSSTFNRFDQLDSRKWVSIQGGYTFDGTNYQLAGCWASKYKGQQDAGSRVYTNDYPIYRYADLLLLLAEAKVILGEDPSTEINMVRQRAYGENFDQSIQGYPNQAVDANPQMAVLQERFFEFVFEGKRWYDLRRMGDNVLFQFVPQSLFSNTNPEGRLLWPIDRNTLINNVDLQQTPGYASF